MLGGGDLGKVVLYMGTPSFMMEVDLFVWLPSCRPCSYQQPLTDALEVNPIISLVRLMEQNFALSLDF